MAEKKEKVAVEAVEKETAKKATTAKSSAAKKEVKEPIVKVVNGKKAPAKKTAAAKEEKPVEKKAEKPAEETVKEVASAKAEEQSPVKEEKPAVEKTPAKKAAKKNAAKAPLYIHGRYVVEKQFPQKPQKGTSPYAAATGKVKVTLVKSTVGCLDDQIATVKALGLTKIRTSNVLPDNAAIRGMIFKVKHLVVTEEVK